MKGLCGPTSLLLGSGLVGKVLGLVAGTCHSSVRKGSETANLLARYYGESIVRWECLPEQGALGLGVVVKDGRLRHFDALEFQRQESFQFT